MNLDKNILLYSCGSDIIVDYIEVCEKNHVQIKNIIHNQEKTNSAIASVSVNDFSFLNNKIRFIVPLFTPYNRYLAVEEALKKGLSPYSILNDRNNDLPIKFHHGLGCFINKRVVIGADSRIGNYVIINRGACLGHHLVLEDYTSIGPGVVTAGGVTIKRGALVATGAIILPNITIGEHAVVAAGAVVTKDVPANTVVAGSPAKKIKENSITF